jgi:hypothetical protein
MVQMLLIGHIHPDQVLLLSNSQAAQDESVNMEGKALCFHHFVK